MRQLVDVHEQYHIVCHIGVVCVCDGDTRQQCLMATECDNVHRLRSIHLSGAPHNSLLRRHPIDIRPTSHPNDVHGMTTANCKTIQIMTGVFICSTLNFVLH